MVTNIAIVGFNGFIGKSIVEYFKKNIDYNIYNCRSVNDLSKIPENYLLIYAAGRFAGTEEDIWDVNVNYFRLILNKFIESKGNKFIYLSSGAVYGASKKEKSKERNVTDPKTFYGLTKLVAEKNILYNAKRFGFIFYILRLPNVYGKKQKKGVIFNFVKNKKEQKPFLIQGSGEDIRDYLHINDLLQSIDLIIKNKPNNGIYNISSDLCLSVLDIAYKISKSRKYPKVFIESNNYLSILTLDTQKACQAFGYKSKINNIYLDE